MSHRTTERGRAVVIAVLVAGVAIFGIGAGAAQADPAVPDLPVSVKVCPVDTSPNSPSCTPILRLVSGSPEPTAIVLHHGWACTGGRDEPVHCEPVLVFCTDDYELCGTVPSIRSGASAWAARAG